MNRTSTLWFFLGAFSLLSGLFLWGYVFDTRTHFMAGAPPPRLPEVLPPPRLPLLRSTDPAKGGTATDTVTIVQFADFTCPACRAEPIIKLFQNTGHGFISLAISL